MRKQQETQILTDHVLLRFHHLGQTTTWDTGVGLIDMFLGLFVFLFLLLLLFSACKTKYVYEHSIIFCLLDHSQDVC